MFTTAKGFTAADLKVTSIRTDANPHNRNRVRKAWVLHCDDVSAKKLQSLPQEIKFMLYGFIDNDVSDKWIELMRKHRENAIAAGGKMILDKDGSERLEDFYCVDSNDQLIAAGEIVAAKIPEYIETLPEAIKKQMVAA
ncbi:RNA polymerase binding protein [Escherichia phage vB_EcoM_ESCO47]|nr:RNA polymerase binding protein [Escherichia phage vB_EcoM_ESCO47]